MPNVTIYGAGGSVQSLPFTTSAAAAAAQNVATGINALIAAGTLTPFTYTGPSSIPTGPGPYVAEFIQGISPGSATLPSATVPDVFSNLTTPLNLLTDPTNVISGTGGLTYTQTTGGGTVVTGGGSNNITLAAGATTVSLDITPTATVGGVGIGTSTVNALAGGAFITVNSTANSPNSLVNALVLAANKDTVVMAGGAAVGIADPSVVVSVLGGGGGFFAGSSVNISLGAGNEVIGVLSGSTETVTGSASGLITEAAIPTVAGAPTTPGSLFINPNGQNVFVYAGAASTTLFGGTGSDTVFGGSGSFTAGTGGNSLLTTGTAGSTLVGGGAGDQLFSAAGNVSLKASTGTTVLSAFTSSVSGGDTLNAAASSATLFGASAGSNTYAAAGGAPIIENFSASDVFKLASGQSVSNVAAGSTGSSVVSLSDGTKITIANGFISTTNVGTYFHS